MKKLAASLSLLLLLTNCASSEFIPNDVSAKSNQVSDLNNQDSDEDTDYWVDYHHRLDDSETDIPPVDPCDPNPCLDAESRCFVAATGYYCSCEPGYEYIDGSCTRKATVSLRIMSANTTSTNKQSYAGPGIRIFQALKPDIVLIQEFRYYPDLDKENQFADRDAFVAGTFGDEFSYHSGSLEGSGDIPNGIVSRYPIIESGTWDDSQVGNRAFEWARIDIPGDKDLLAISVHLLTKNASVRQSEARSLVNYIKENRKNDEYVVIGGDINTDSRSEAALKTLNDIVVTQATSYPVDQDDNPCTNIKRGKTYDGVYASRALHQIETTLKVGEQEFPTGLVFDSRSFEPLSDAAPVLKADSTYGQMQHMPVIREFKLW